ncbi:MAG: Fic family protein [Methylotenera sp.]|nr:Fic family protein [Methylotenera sp.]
MSEQNKQPTFLVRPITELVLEVFETLPIMKKLASANRALAELKGIVASIPNQGVLIDTLSIQEAKESSEIESIVTTHDELFQQGIFPDKQNPAAKEVKRYVEALHRGHHLLCDTGLMTSNHIKEIQAVLEGNDAGFRTQSGTTLRTDTGNIVYTPPQQAQEIELLMQDLEKLINDASYITLDPLIKMAIIHHQFETIHPFYDGNGRTGRIINVLYLVQQNLLNIPVLYLSAYINKNKQEYYRLLQSVRDDGKWEPWILYMLDAVENTANITIGKILAIRDAMMQYKHHIRSHYNFYSQDLINHLFKYPYTKISFLETDINVSRITATKYLKQLSADEKNILQLTRKGRDIYFINTALYKILVTN